MIQAMASHSQSQAGGGGYAGPSGRQPQGLARQGSLYSLTLDEVQNQLTEPLLSMNLDELLKSVFPDGVDPDGAVAGQSEPPSGLHRQGSITMPPELSKKTVDEVWKGILDSPKRKSGEEGGWRRRERQLTLGEMTLEDFLLKAGVVTEGCLKDSSSDFPPNMDAAGSSGIAVGAPSLSSTPQAQWLQQYQQQALEPPHPSMAGSFMASQLAPQPLAVATGAILESIYSDAQITSPMLSALSDPQTPGCKRGASSGGVPDKVVERRQKRMIKNRESAARSRARKQAYTNELENKVSHLEEENERLKRQKLQKPETGKKRPPESSLKTLASNKKAKVATLSGQNTGCEVKAGESKVSPEGDRLLHLSEGALGKVKKDHEATIFVKVDDRKLSIGTLSTDKSLQVMFDLVFREEFELLHTSKSSSVIFSGYKGIQQGEGEPKDEEEGQKIVAAAKEDGMQTSSSSLKSAHVEPILGKFKKDEGSDEEREKIAPAPKENVKAQANDKKPEHVNIESADVESILGKSKKDEDSDEDVESILGKSKKDEDIDEDDDDGSFDKWLPIQDYEVAEYYYIEVEEETPK